MHPERQRLVVTHREHVEGTAAEQQDDDGGAQIGQDETHLGPRGPAELTEARAAVNRHELA